MGVMPLFENLHCGALLSDVDCIAFSEDSCCLLSTESLMTKVTAMIRISSIGRASVGRR